VSASKYKQIFPLR